MSNPPTKLPMKKLVSRFSFGALLLLCTLFAFSALADANLNAASEHSGVGSSLPNGSSGLHLMKVADVAGHRSSSVGLPGRLAVATQNTANSSPATAALFPIIGLIVAISATQLLRRRRISQQRSSSAGGM